MCGDNLIENGNGESVKETTTCQNQIKFKLLTIKLM